MKLAIVIVCALGGIASAYPQFQMSRDQMCSACHLNPEGGNGLLTENGNAFLEANSTWDQSGEFFYNKFKLPDWLVLGGDVRGATGYVRTPQNYYDAFPMQFDVYAGIKLPKHLKLLVTAGYRPPQAGNEAATTLWSREHYLLWSQDPDGQKGWFARIGRFMPIFGLRYAEHPTYTRQYGGTKLYTETYGAAVEYVQPEYEAHLTGFVKDPLIDPVGQDNGIAAYAEVRPTTRLSVGGEFMATKSDDDHKWRPGVTAKYYLPGPDLMIMFEGQYVVQRIPGHYNKQIVAELTATKFFPGNTWLDVSLGHYDEQLDVPGVDRDALDVNFHWLATSHIELFWTNRLELVNQGRTQPDGLGAPPTGAYSLLQAHYRL